MIQMIKMEHCLIQKVEFLKQIPLEIRITVNNLFSDNFQQ